MHISSKAFFVVLCAIFSASVHADDFITLVEKNFPYQEVEESYGVANIEAGRCQEGTPFSISQKRFQNKTNIDLAAQVHERLRSMGANAFVINELQEGTLVRSITVTPLACQLS